MKKLGVVSVLTLVLSVAATAPAPAPASAASSPPGSRTFAQESPPSPRPGFDMSDKWARETTRYGDADTSAYSIDHVTELQYRLRWAGVFHAAVTGTFGKVTRAAVRRLQQREGLRVTGVAGHLTWAHLIHDTIRHRGVVPHICKTRGWHACYDRAMHQVTLWHAGEMRNSWLVRGGEYGLETRVGNSHVYYRDIDHVSTTFGSAMPYSQFFDGGEAYHGSPYMINPFVGHSHGCINMYIEDARQLWNLTAHKKLYVSVYGHWD